MRKNLSKWAFVTFAVAICFILHTSVSAQTVSGTMQGRITDSNGAVIPGATIVVTNQETGQVRTVTSNNDGLYNVPFLPIGKYTVDATRNDFNKVVKSEVQISLNETTVVNFQLDPTVKGEVQITAEAPPINTTNAQVSSTLTNEQIIDRPVANQSNFLTLAETFGGFAQNPDVGSANNPTLSVGSSISFNGTGSRGATFQINGVNNDDSSENQNRQGASLATIKEFQVITNNFTAEFGRGYGAVVLVQTLSGTNKFKGSAYLYHNSSALNAKSYFAHTAKPVNRRNQFGATAGFPLLKNKLFGFVSFDRTENSGKNTYTRDVFLPSERDPANWFKTTPTNDSPSNRAFIKSVIDRFPSFMIPNDPANRTPRTYVGEQGFDRPDEDYSGRLDWNPNQSDSIFIRYQYTRQRRNAEEIIVGEVAEQNNRQQNVGMTWTHVFSPQLVGEFRYGLGLRTTLANIQAGNDTPIIRFTFAGGVGGSIIGNAGAFPINRFQTDNQYVYNVSWIPFSSHFIKMGVDIRDQQIDDLADNFSRGFYNFNSVTCNGVTYRTTYPNGTIVTSAFESFLNGCVNNFQKGYAKSFFIKNNLGEYNAYAEDNWKILSNLTLNLGVRYEYVDAPREENNLVAYGFGDDKNNVEPRLGFAYSPSFEKGIFNKIFGSAGNSSIRGGYGVYHGRLFQSVFSQGGVSVRTNAPNAFFFNQTAPVNTAFNAIDLANPTRSLVFTPGLDPLTSGRLSRNLLVDPNLEMPYTKQFTLSLERQLPWKTSLRVTYTGNRGYGLLRYNFGNAPNNDPNGVLVANHPNNAPEILYTAANRPVGDPRAFDTRGQILRPAANILCAGTGLANVPTNATCPTAVPLGNLEYSLRVPRTTERRPDPLFFGYSQVNNGARTWYDGLQVEFIKRLSDGLNFQANFTWSKGFDTTSETTSFGAGDSNQTGNDLKLARGLSRTHTPRRFTLLGTYRLPFFAKEKNILGQAFGGWQLSTVLRLVHGNPFTVTYAGVDLNLDNFSESRPSLNDPSILGRSINNPNTARDRLPVSAFRPTGFAEFGCCIVGRNTFYADGLATIDFALSKKFSTPFEGHSLYVRGDFFNAFNHVQYAIPSPTWAAGSTTFGTITGTGGGYSPRNIQVSLRYVF